MCGFDHRGDHIKLKVLVFFRIGFCSKVEVPVNNICRFRLCVMVLMFLLSAYFYEVECYVLVRKCVCLFYHNNSWRMICFVWLMWSVLTVHMCVWWGGGGSVWMSMLYLQSLSNLLIGYPLFRYLVGICLWAIDITEFVLFSTALMIHTGTPCSVFTDKCSMTPECFQGTCYRMWYLLS